MTDAERRAEENRRILERIHGVPVQHDPFAMFDPANLQRPLTNDNTKPVSETSK